MITLSAIPSSATLLPSALLATRSADPVSVQATIVSSTDENVATDVRSTLDSGAFSSPALSQLISAQEADPDSTVQFAPAPVYNTLVQYSFVKYKPSDAGIPQEKIPFEPVATSAAASGQAAPQPVKQYTAYSTTQSRNHTQLKNTAPQTVAAG